RVPLLEARHFSPHFHNLHRIVRCHVRAAAEEDALAAIANAPPPEPASDQGIDAWAFFERYAALHPDDAMPLAARFVSRARVDARLAWLARIAGVRSTVTAAGALEIRHAVAGGTLVVSPASVRRVALCPERFALSMTLEDERGSSEVSIGTEDFYFA